MINKAQLKQLQAEWYQRLRETGFDDIEQTAESNAKLRSWHSYHFSIQHDPSRFQAKQEYYYKATQYLDHGKFRTKTEKHLWKLHSEGLGLRQIVVVMKTNGFHYNKDQCAAIVRRIKEEMMGIKKPVKEEEKPWKNLQLDLFDGMI